MEDFQFPIFKSHPTVHNDIVTVIPNMIKLVIKAGHLLSPFMFSSETEEFN